MGEFSGRKRMRFGEKMRKQVAFGQLKWSKNDYYKSICPLSVDFKQFSPVSNQFSTNFQPILTEFDQFRQN